MTTELWQRLAAARRYGNKKQIDIAEACVAELGGRLTRNAVSLWESAKPETRTTPNIDQLRVVSKETGVDLMWIMTDGESLDPKPISLLGEAKHYFSPIAINVPVKGVAVVASQGMIEQVSDDPEGNGYFVVVVEDKEAYYLRVRGPGSIFAVEPGWYILLSPNSRPESSEKVAVKFRDGRWFLGAFDRKDGGEYVLRRPDGTQVVFSEADIEFVHPIHGTMSPKQVRREAK